MGTAYSCKRARATVYFKVRHLAHYEFLPCLARMRLTRFTTTSSRADCRMAPRWLPHTPAKLPSPAAHNCPPLDAPSFISSAGAAGATNVRGVAMETSEMCTGGRHTSCTSRCSPLRRHMS